MTTFLPAMAAIENKQALLALKAWDWVTMLQKTSNPQA
jgi:hypothetical protein